ncbi:MAG: hypothetical protein PWR13_1328 [Archaeoglobi archaeon]|nr:hypothetical protein [Archaeoglobi archaeon]MDK2782300.1 hypothetical protein [Archaeoglobi archaeon]
MKMRTLEISDETGLIFESIRRNMEMEYGEEISEDEVVRSMISSYIYLIRAIETGEAVIELNEGKKLVITVSEVEE